MTAVDEVKIVLREIVGPALRAHGFAGSGRTWRRTNDLGDVAVVNVQSSSSSDSDQARLVVNLAVAPQPWMEFNEFALGPVKTVLESHGLYRDRLHARAEAPDWDNWWRIANRSEAESAAQEMVEMLDAEGIPVLLRLLDRAEMVKAIVERNKAIFRDFDRDSFIRAEALLISDDGPSDRLEELLDQLLTSATAIQQDFVLRLAAWLRRRARTKALNP